jgi:hypothetical protein
MFNVYVAGRYICRRNKKRKIRTRTRTRTFLSFFLSFFVLFSFFRPASPCPAQGDYFRSPNLLYWGGSGMMEDGRWRMEGVNCHVVFSFAPSAASIARWPPPLLGRPLPLTGRPSPLPGWPSALPLRVTRAEILQQGFWLLALPPTLKLPPSGPPTRSTSAPRWTRRSPCLSGALLPCRPMPPWWT